MKRCAKRISKRTIAPRVLNQHAFQRTIVDAPQRRIPVRPGTFDHARCDGIGDSDPGNDVTPESDCTEFVLLQPSIIDCAAHIMTTPLNLQSKLRNHFL
jgi:hypothetical protein